MNETGTKQIAAVGFLVMAFTDETAADETLKELKKPRSSASFISKKLQ